MLEINIINSSDAKLIQDLAKKVWEPTYGDILNIEQLAYMFDQMYSLSSLKKQMDELKHIYYVAYFEDDAIGYFSIERIDKKLIRLHKIYVVPDMQNKGVGYFLLQKAVLCAKQLTDNNEFVLQLNVNRHNKKAIDFYTKQGFINKQTVDICIGNDFFMNDYIFEFKVN